MAGGTYQDPALGRTTQAAFWSRFIETSLHLRPSTRAVYETLMRLHVLPQLGARPLAQLTRLDVEGWAAKLAADGIGPPTIGAAHRFLRRVLFAAEEAGIITRNPARRVRAATVRRTEMRFLTAEELHRVVDAVPEQHRALVFLLGYGGLRFGEAIALEREDLDLLRRRVQVTKAASEVRGGILIGPTKTGASRAVPIPAFVADQLAAHQAAFSPGPGLVFPDTAGTSIRRTNWRRRVWARRSPKPGSTSRSPAHMTSVTRPRPWPSPLAPTPNRSRRCLGTRR
jgi:integrase